MYTMLILVYISTSELMNRQTCIVSTPGCWPEHQPTSPLRGAENIEKSAKVFFLKVVGVVSPSIRGVM